jgi:hypothetical protein
MDYGSLPGIKFHDNADLNASSDIRFPSGWHTVDVPDPNLHYGSDMLALELSPILHLARV